MINKAFQYPWWYINMIEVEKETKPNQPPKQNHHTAEGHNDFCEL